MLPGGDAVIFTIWAGTGSVGTKIGAVSPSSGQVTPLIDNASYGRFASSGHLVFERDEALWAAPFDAGGLTVGEAVPMLDEVLTDSAVGVPYYALSENGTIVYAPGGILQPGPALAWVDLEEAVEPLPLPSRVFAYPRISPDGRKLAVTIVEGELSNLYLSDLERGGGFNAFTSEGSNSIPVWSPDSSQLAFASYRSDQWGLFMGPADQSEPPRELTTGDSVKIPSSFSSDGDILAYTEWDPEGTPDIRFLTLGSSPTHESFLGTPNDEYEAMFSPDDQWVAYVSNQTGQREIYIRGVGGAGGTYQISTEGGTEPEWSVDGDEIYFRSGDRVMVVSVPRPPRFVAGTPQLLFDGPYDPEAFFAANYDFDPNENRFLVISNAQLVPTRELRVVLNWFEELKDRARTER
jgi:hypothetical protein